MENTNYKPKIELQIKEVYKRTGDLTGGGKKNENRGTTKRYIHWNLAIKYREYQFRNNSKNSENNEQKRKAKTRDLGEEDIQADFH